MITRLPLLLLLTAAGAVAQNLTDAQLAGVKANLMQSANQSWELGVEAEALTEFDYPTLAVFSPLSIPPPTHLNSSYNASEVLAIANNTVRNKPANIQPLMQDEAAGDPPSIGQSVLLANYTGATGADFAGAAEDQLNYLLYTAPRTDQGAISHRADQVQLWSDFIYMTPPFIAYYGALTLNQTLLQIAYEQISLYRDQLRDSNGLWRHITLGTGTDEGHWATGNGWASAGILRVMMTIQRSAFASQMSSQINDLNGWANEIVTAAWSYQQSNGTLLNYLDQSNSFADSSSTALLASVSYRLASLSTSPHYSTIPHAEKARALIASSGISSSGWLQPVVNPDDFPFLGTHSPEGQAFVLLMQSAWRDYTLLGQPGLNGSAPAGAAAGGILSLMQDLTPIIQALGLIGNGNGRR